MRICVLVGLALTLPAAAGCRGSDDASGTPIGLGGATRPDAGAAPVDAAAAPSATDIDRGCPDIFTQESLREYELTIAPGVWSRLMADFAAGPPPDDASNTYYPVASFVYQGETRTDASIRLKGKGSWTYALEDPDPKAQFVVAFDQQGTKVKFHGVDQIDLDMYDHDLSMLNERLAFAIMRAAGLPVPCANSAELTINGATYGLYVSEERYGKTLLERLFPGESGGVLLESGVTVQANASAEDLGRLDALWAAHDVPSMLATHVDIYGSMLAWAAESVINDADGYWGGNHNFYIYDHPTRGFLWMSVDIDSAFAWIPVMQHPVFWWAHRYWVPPYIPQHYVAVVTDPLWESAFAASIAEIQRGYDTARFQGWMTGWAQQIAPAVARDPRRPFTVAAQQAAVAAIDSELAQRADYLQSFLDCERTGAPDADGDGYPWCRDCDDTRADVYPGAPEICGDGIDQNCNGVADEGCPPQRSIND